MPKHKQYTLKKYRITKHKKHKTRYISKNYRIFKSGKYNKFYYGGDIINPTYVPYEDGGAFNKLNTQLNKTMIQSVTNASTDK
jgi:hypothetical protein